MKKMIGRMVKVLCAIGAVFFLIVAGSLFVMPAINERRIHAFCEGIQIGEDAADVWKRGDAFTRERGAHDMDFSVSLPSLFIHVWHCNASIDQKGQVTNKTIGCED